MYLKLDLADERYCDGCPLCEPRGWCVALQRDLELAVGVVGQCWLRPQACIDASAKVEPLREPAQALVDFVHSRHPGEPFYCPYMLALEQALAGTADRSKR